MRYDSQLQFSLREIQYFFEQFVIYSGTHTPNQDDIEKQCFYFDAAVVSLVSLPELLSKKDRRPIFKIKEFQYFKAVRNTMVHYLTPHAIFVNQEVILFNRVYVDDQSARLKVNKGNSIEFFSEIVECRKRRDEKDYHSYSSAVKYLESIDVPIYLDELFDKTIRSILKAF